jgi:hypothetical protein
MFESQRVVESVITNTTTITLMHASHTNLFRSIVDLKIFAPNDICHRAGFPQLNVDSFLSSNGICNRLDVFRAGAKVTDNCLKPDDKLLDVKKKEEKKGKRKKKE